MTVHFIGAGPGASDLLTLRGRDLIAASPVCLYAGSLVPERIVGVETGGCPHTAIREDASINLAAVGQLTKKFPDLDLILIESGGDNLASTFSSDLVDYWLFVIDVGGGGDVPRKRGPGTLRCDILVVNKTDLAPHVGVDLPKMLHEAIETRCGRAVVATNCLTGEGVQGLTDDLVREVLFVHS